MAYKVLVLGGYGVFGSQICDALARDANLALTVAGRDPARGERFAASLGANFARLDATDPASLRAALAATDLVINTAGPFQIRGYELPELCIQGGRAYVDIGDGRGYVEGFGALDAAARAAGVFVCTGASSSPAITAALLESLLPELGTLCSVRVALSAGNKNRPGLATITSILSYVGAPVRVWEEGAWVTHRGWTMGTNEQFPAPVGRRRVQLCDTAELGLFPARYGAARVVFRAGVELNLFNDAIGALGGLRRLVPAFHPDRLAAPLTRLSDLFKAFGSLAGAVAVWATDADGRERGAAVVAPRNGPRVASSPAVLLARDLAAGRITQAGAFQGMGLLSVDALAAFLAPFDIFLARSEDGHWTR
ncbi:MAG: saccharopine dehydrogenase NADP-binding domain-containing protein [Thermoflexales bacterium]|nr:saccharopine dehydrogenase NADP-binding domain-containing protein [Thermoflexales bacterium]